MDSETEKLWDLMEGCECSYRGILTTSEMFSGALTEPEWLKVTSCSYLCPLYSDMLA